MKVSINKALILLLISSMLLACFGCAGGGKVEPFTRPPSTDEPQKTDGGAEQGAIETPDAEPHGFTFKNELTSALFELYISPSDSDSWGEPVRCDIGAGEMLNIGFSDFGGVPGEKYDIGTIDENGVNYDCFYVVLVEGDSIILSGSAEKADLFIERADGTVQTVAAKVYSDENGGEKRSAFIQPYLSTKSDYSEISTNSYEMGVSTSFAAVRLNSNDAKKFPLLDRALKALNDRRMESSSGAYGAFVERAGMASGLSSVASFPASEFNDDAFVISSEETVLSLLFVHSETIGGRTVFKYDAAAFDPETGAQLMLSDAAEDIQKLEKSIYAELERAYGEIPFDEDFELIKEFSAPSEKLVWMIDPSGLCILINGAPLDGEAEVYSVFLPFGEYSDIFYERYLPKNEDRASAFPLDFNYQTVIEGKRSTLKVSVLNDEALLRIQYNGAEHEIELNGVYEVKAHFVHANGRDLMYLDMLSDNDSRFLSVLSFEDDAIVRLGEFRGSWGYNYEIVNDAVSRLVQPMVDPESFTLYSKTQLLGTADGIKPYCVGENGLPKTEDEYYLIINPDIEFTLKQPLELHFVTEEGDIDVAAISLEAGSTLGYLRTDNKRFADLILEDGRFVRAVIDDGCIAAVPLEELFEGIEYSG